MTVAAGIRLKWHTGLPADDRYPYEATIAQPTSEKRTHRTARANTPSSPRTRGCVQTHRPSPHEQERTRVLSAAFDHRGDITTRSAAAPHVHPLCRPPGVLRDAIDGNAR